MLFNLAKAGFGTYMQLREEPAETILDMLEFESIQADIEHYRIEEARRET